MLLLFAKFKIIGSVSDGSEVLGEVTVITDFRRLQDMSGVEHIVASNLVAMGIPPDIALAVGLR